MVVQIRDLIVRYQVDTEKVTVLDVSSWHVASHAQVALAGPSGSGKSTLLNVMAGLLAPSSGNMLICNQDLSRLTESGRDRFRAAHVSYIFQTFNLLPGYTAIENVLLGAAFAGVHVGRRQAADLLDSMGLGHRLRHLPHRLSIGEQQRVAIARALVKRPALILADEPTGSLDPKHSEGVVHLLRSAAQEAGSALVVVSHERIVTGAFDTCVDFTQLNRALHEGAGT